MKINEETTVSEEQVLFNKLNWENQQMILRIMRCLQPCELSCEVVEEKKIPEKLPYYSLEKIQKAKNKDEWREERISLLEKRVEDLHIKMNDLLDYLKSKGDE